MPVDTLKTPNFALDSAVGGGAMRCSCGAWAKIEATRQTPDGTVRVYACGQGHKFRTDGKPVKRRCDEAIASRNARILLELAKGRTGKSIAEEFGVAPSTVASLNRHGRVMGGSQLRRQRGARA